MNIRLNMPQGRSSLQRFTCSLKERREWSDSVSCKEPTSKLYVHSFTDSLRTSTTVEASRLGDDCHLHSSRVAPQLHSPTLMSLRSGSSADSRDTGRRGKATKLHSNIEAKQRELTSKHQSAKSGPGVGGGITMWPGMDDMRLSQTETLQLTAAALCLIVGSMCLFMYLHGPLLSQLEQCSVELSSFPAAHPLIVDQTEYIFVQSLQDWHRSFHRLLVRIDSEVNVKWRSVSPLYSTFWVLYMAGATCLLHFFIASVFAKDRLTPRRIKIWVSLLCVIATWTCLAMVLLFRALEVEEAVKMVVAELSDHSVDLIESGWSLQLYQVVLLHWRSKCLPPSGQGLLLVMGLLRLQDLAYYLQYYSVPLLTAILAPIVKIIASLRTVYFC